MLLKCLLIQWTTASFTDVTQSTYKSVNDKFQRVVADYNGKTSRNPASSITLDERAEMKVLLSHIIHANHDMDERTRATRENAQQWKTLESLGEQIRLGVESRASSSV